MRFMICLFSCFTIILTVVGCGTDVKPTAFVDILRDPTDADELSACLSEDPVVGDATVQLTLDKQCLVDFSNQDQTDPSLAPSFAEVVANPEAYMDKLLTFEAVAKRVDPNRNVELYTNDINLRFYIHTQGAQLYRLDADGEEVPIEPNETYRFTCRIYNMHKNIDRGSVWTVDSEFLVSTNKKIIHLPELVE